MGGMVYRCYIKILIDIFVAVLSLIALMPVFGVIAAAIKWDSEGPVLFKQKRCGQYGRTFLIYKFRTMYKTAPYDRPVKELKNPEQYITRTGRVLRRTSLDELPQIFNMIKGEMSLIGPRPFLLAEGEVLAAREKAGITAVRPGITMDATSLAMTRKWFLTGSMLKISVFLQMQPFFSKRSVML